MDNVKNDLYYANKIQEDLAFIIKHMKDVDEDELAHNELLQDSMMFQKESVYLCVHISRTKMMKAKKEQQSTDFFCKNWKSWIHWMNPMEY